VHGAPELLERRDRIARADEREIDFAQPIAHRRVVLGEVARLDHARLERRRRLGPGRREGRLAVPQALERVGEHQRGDGASAGVAATDARAELTHDQRELRVARHRGRALERMHRRPHVHRRGAGPGERRQAALDLSRQESIELRVAHVVFPETRPSASSSGASA
jgi:hypothetical protein